MRPRCLACGALLLQMLVPASTMAICLRVNGAKAAYPPPREFGAEAVVRITGLRGALWALTRNEHRVPIRFPRVRVMINDPEGVYKPRLKQSHSYQQAPLLSRARTWKSGMWLGGVGGTDPCKCCGMGRAPPSTGAAGRWSTGAWLNT